jgi:hypothetical protein
MNQRKASETRSRVLLQLDSDPHPSVFDAVVAVDSQVDHLLRHGSVSPDQVQELVHGTIFTRGPKELKGTAIFVGGTDVVQGEALLCAVQETFFGPMRVSVMMDSNGSNTTAAAAVLAAEKHVNLRQSRVSVLAATGPVGRRVVRLLASQGAEIQVGSRSLRRAEEVCETVQSTFSECVLHPVQTGTNDLLLRALDGSAVVIAAGSPGTLLLPQPVRVQAKHLQVAVDLNAVPPLGMEEVDVMDQGVDRDGIVCYGAIGVGALKMKIHKTAIQRLFERNDLVLDAEEIYALGAEILSSNA